MLRKIIHKVTFGLLYKERFLLLKIGCFQYFQVAHNLYSIFKLNKLTPQHREIIFRDLFKEEDVCPINNNRHDLKHNYPVILAAMTLIRLNHETELSDEEITQIAVFLGSKSERQKEFSHMVEYFLESGQLPYSEYNAFAQLFRQKEISRDFVIQLLPIFISRYDILPFSNIANPGVLVPDYGTLSQAQEHGDIEDILKALILDNINLQREDYLALAYNSNPRIREIATSTHRCPKEGKIAVALMDWKEEKS